MFSEISQNSQENTCARVSVFNKVAGLTEILLKKRLWHRCFPVYFAKFLRAPFLQNRTPSHDYFFTWFCGPNAWKNQRKFPLSYLAPLSLVWDSSFPFACRLYDTNNAKKRKTFEKSQKRLSFNHTIIFIASK